MSKPKTKKAIAQLQAIKEFRKMLAEAMKFGTRMDDDVLREVESIVSGMVHFAPKLLSSIKANQQLRFHSMMLRRSMLDAVKSAKDGGQHAKTKRLRGDRKLRVQSR